MMKRTPVGDIARFVRGITFKPEDVCENHIDGSVVCMRTKNVQSVLDVEDLISVPASFVRRKEQRLQEGDLLISSANSWNLVGKACWVPKFGFDATAGGFISILRCDRELVDPRFFYYWVTSDETQHKLRNCGRQTTNISNLDFDQAKALEVPIPLRNGKPNLVEQKRLAAILDKANAIRRKRQQALRLTDDFLRSLFLDMFGDPVTNPKGWEIRPLKFVVGNSFRNGISPSNRGSVAGEVLTLGAITSGKFRRDEIKTAMFDRIPSVNQRVTSETFLICRGNGNLRLVGAGVFPNEEMPHVAFPDTMIAVNIDRSLVEPAYLQSVWSTSHVRQQIERGARTTNGTYKVNQSLLGSIEIPLPNLTLQAEYAKVVVKTSEKRQKIYSFGNDSSALFTSLQQRAFRGDL